MSNTDIEHKRKKVEDLEGGNQRSYTELREATGGRFSMDTSDLRRELLIDHLVEWGIISEDQKLDFEIKFHTEVEQALSGAWQQYRDARRHQAKLSVVKKPTALLDQNGRPIGG